MYASSSDARCWVTSMTGRPRSPSRATTCSAGRPETVSVSRSPAVTVAPALASKVMASERPGVRTRI
jgi:hypothetical protein